MLGRPLYSAAGLRANGFCNNSAPMRSALKDLNPNGKDRVPRTVIHSQQEGPFGPPSSGKDS